jgi:hypothetical protein
VSSCEGLHCPGCQGGGGKAVAVGGGIVAVVLAVEWVAAHAWEVLAVTTVCGALAVAAVVALMRWADRRKARHAARAPVHPRPAAARRHRRRAAATARAPGRKRLHHHPRRRRGQRRRHPPRDPRNGRGRHHRREMTMTALTIAADDRLPR